MMGQAFPDTISRTAAVVAPGLMVMAIILFMGKVSGAHLNPAVSIAFALRGDFPWRACPATSSSSSSARRSPRCSCGRRSTSRRRTGRIIRRRALGGRAFPMEALLTLGLVERHPWHCFGGAEHRHLRCARRWRVHRARRTVGQPDLGRLDEPCPHLRARPCRPAFTGYGSTSSARSPERLRGGLASSSAVRAAAGPARPRRKVGFHPGSAGAGVALTESRTALVDAVGRLVDARPSTAPPRRRPRDLGRRRKAPTVGAGRNPKNSPTRCSGSSCSQRRSSAWPPAARSSHASRVLWSPRARSPSGSPSAPASARSRCCPRSSPTGSNRPPEHPPDPRLVEKAAVDLDLNPKWRPHLSTTGFGLFDSPGNGCCWERSAAPRRSGPAERSRCPTSSTAPISREYMLGTRSNP